MQQATGKLGGLAADATLETRLRLPGPSKGQSGHVGVLSVEAPEVVPYKGSERAREALLEHRDGGEGSATLRREPCGAPASPSALARAQDPPHVHVRHLARVRPGGISSRRAGLE